MSKLVDIYGQPLTMTREMQTEQTEDLARVARRVPEHPTSGLTPAKAAALLKDAESGSLSALADLAQDMQTKNAHMFSEISKRRRTVSLLPWNLKPPLNPTPQEEKDTAMLEEYLRDADWFNDMVFDATDGILKGYACQEIEWSAEERLIVPKAVHFRSAAIFKTGQDNQTLLLDDNTPEGIPLNPFGWIIHRAKSMSGYLSEIALARVLVWPFIFASYPIRDLLEFLEIYGIPMRLGRYNAGATKAEKDTLMQAVMSIGHHAAGIIPVGMEIEFKEAAQGQSDQFLNVIAWAEKLMSKAIIGGTLTTQADGKTSTNALGNIHEEIRLEIRNSDVIQLQPTLNRDLIYPLWALNAKSFTSPRRRPRLTFDTSESEDIGTLAVALKPMVEAGMRIAVKDMHERMQIPMAGENEPILTIQAPALPPFEFLSRKASLSRNNPDNAALAPVDGAQAALDGAIEAMDSRDWNAAMDPIIAPIVMAIKTKGLDYAKVMITELYGETDSQALETMLTQAFLAADLWGEIHGSE